MFAAQKTVSRIASFAAASALLGGVLAAAPVGAGAPPADGTGSDSSGKDLIPKVKPASANDLEFRPGSLSVVTDAESGQRFWVFSYTIANKTGKTQRFSPRFELLMGDGVILSAGKDVPLDAARRVQRAAASAQAVDQFQIMGDILDGEANAREGFVIWPAKGDSKDITLFVTGMSSSFDRRTDPATGKDVIVRRSWSRHYTAPGVADPRLSQEASFDPLKDAWLMR
jgi:hypothetical protein